MKRVLTKYPGVYELVSKIRKHNGRSNICFYITYWLEGKKIWEKVGWASEGYTAKLASQLRADRMMKIRHGEEIPRQKQKAPYFKEVANKYLEWASQNKAREGKDDKLRYKNHLAAALGDRRMNEITPFDLERFKSSLAKEDLSPGSIKHCLVLVRQIFNKAKLWGMYRGENPIKGVKLPVLQNQRERFLTYDEASQLLKELKNTSELVHDMALVSLHCGLRAGEIFNLKRQDLDFENGLINILNPKNKESRKAFMTKDVKAVLIERAPTSPSELVFKDKRYGDRIQFVSNTFMKCVSRLKLNEGVTDPRQKITFHSLRHTFASWLAMQGETILTIKELLGHKTLAMTVRYAHLIPDHKRQAALKLERTFKQKSKQTHSIA